ncbi:ABC transporter permease [Rhizosaccharibacter radicis]|uniref:Iron export ABC transporter permease subunit FetB n=1 Tax=Rhizosaccharibacter radicis TaxID=2782605 RepID=A0ABT1VTA1_9PROT|nr:iron export ABC transporter permease subunit FetB [Acetobacteraceae bacterium KSS12]
MNAILLSPLDLAVAATLLAAEAVLSMLFGLGLHRPLLVATSRMVVQLVLVGYVLRFVFAVASPALILLLVVLMILIAAREVAARPRQRLRGGGNLLIGFASVASSTALTVILALTTAIQPTPWWTPQYAIPLAGIVLGSVLSAASLSLDHVLDRAAGDRAAIEARLLLGHSFRDATAGLRLDATRRGMLPIVNQMSAAGLVTLPGIMTGQILAGADPIQSVKYQILLMLLLGGGSVMASFLAAALALRRLTDDRQRLRLDWLENRRPARSRLR